ncbi:MAG TPA: penicillin-binding transpeptidase domain-containing protein, partial [Armatimonadota bacterium]|nr:penicillin-binding transpeptidase domain-containing protein [Armatimonadota bacterium]
LERNLSLAIGTSEVTPLELASAYGCFATGGLHAKPIAIVRVIGRNDRVMEENRPSLTRAIPYETAKVMADILRGVVTRGTGRRAHVIPGACGKTGTSQDLRDAWFVGFTKDLSAAVWVGNDDYTPMGPSTFGGSTCAPVWVGLMQTALPIIARHQRAQPKADIARREAQERQVTTPEERQRIRQEIEQNTVFRVVCLESEQLAVRQCPRRKRVGFPRGFEPTETCVLHGTGADDVGVQEAPVASDSERPSGHEPMPLDSGGAASHPASPVRPDQESGPTAHGNRASSGAAGGAASGSPAGASARIEEVTICTSSNKRANEYCPEVEVRKMPESQIPGVCTLHGASAGADGGT